MWRACAFFPRLAKIKLLDLGIQQERARIQMIDNWVLSTSLLLDVSGVFQPPEGLSWWRTVSLSVSRLEQAQPVYLGASKSLFSRSLRLCVLIPAQQLTWAPFPRS